MNLINGIAQEMKEIKARGGKIGVVGGPAIVHTGSGKYLASLVVLVARLQKAWHQQSLLLQVEQQN